MWCSNFSQNLSRALSLVSLANSHFVIIYTPRLSTDVCISLGVFVHREVGVHTSYIRASMPVLQYIS